MGQEAGIVGVEDKDLTHTVETIAAVDLTTKCACESAALSHEWFSAIRWLNIAIYRVYDVVCRVWSVEQSKHPSHKTHNALGEYYTMHYCNIC